MRDNERPVKYVMHSKRDSPEINGESIVNEIDVNDIGQILRDLARIWIRDLGRTPLEVAEILEIPLRDVRLLLRTGRCDVVVLERMLAISGMSLEEIFTLHPQVIDSPVLDTRSAIMKLIGVRATIEELRLIWEFIQITREMPSLRDFAHTSAAGFMNVARGLGYNKNRGDAYLDSTVGKVGSESESEDAQIIPGPGRR